MGFRYNNGIGVVESCEKALPHYEYAANFAIQKISKRGYTKLIDKSKLSDILDPNAKWLKTEATQELTDYYEHLSDKGDANAALTLGQLYLFGTRLINIDHHEAIYFLNVAVKIGGLAQASGQLGLLLLKKYVNNVNFKKFNRDIGEQFLISNNNIINNNNNKNNNNNDGRNFYKNTNDNNDNNNDDDDDDNIDFNNDEIKKNSKKRNLDFVNNISYILDLVEYAYKRGCFLYLFIFIYFIYKNFIYLFIILNYNL
jgi:hypothetical protein